MENELEGLDEEVLADETVQQLLRQKSAEKIEARRQAQVDAGLDSEINVVAMQLEHLMADPKSSVKEMDSLLQKALAAQRRKQMLGR